MCHLRWLRCRLLLQLLSSASLQFPPPLSLSPRAVWLKVCGKTPKSLVLEPLLLPASLLRPHASARSQLRGWGTRLPSRRSPARSPFAFVLAAVH